MQGIEEAGVDISGRTRLVGVIGWPVAHTLSPPMQNAALRALGLDWVYVAMAVRPEDLAAALAGARALGFVGLNATIPHKEALARLVDELDPAARAVGAVNTVLFKEGRAVGYNSDVYGYIRTVEVEGNFNFRGRTVLQLGAGGVGRAMAAGAAQAGAARIVIANRDEGRGGALAEAMRENYPETRFETVPSPEAARAAAEADLIANATSLGMKADDPLPIEERAIESRHVVFDTVYRPAETPLLRGARGRGARTVGGLGMLARQGAWSLDVWTRGRETGVGNADEDLMLRVLSELLGSQAPAGSL